MEAAGLVRRTRDPEDERRVVIELTESGKILRNQAVYVPETLARGRKSEGIDELRDSVRRLVELLAEQTGSKR
jgi:DNA-binding MarR family transcriptional regulator